MRHVSAHDADEHYQVGLEPGRYSLAGWQYEDTGNISLSIQRVEEDAGSGGGFDD